MKTTMILFFRACSFLLGLLLLAACAGRLVGRAAGSTPEVCATAETLAVDFYAANDAGDVEASLELLTDDVALITWAEGANGYHMTPSFSVGKTQLRERLDEAGLRLTAVAPERPSFAIENQRMEGNTLRFELMPDRLRPNGRPFNHYSVELVFKGCQIEIIKVVERVTWL